jgi:hypothetical protein
MRAGGWRSSKCVEAGLTVLLNQVLRFEMLPKLTRRLLSRMRNAALRSKSTVGESASRNFVNEKRSELQTLLFLLIALTVFSAHGLVACHSETTA